MRIAAGIFVIGTLSNLMLVGCNSESADIQETGQQLGDVMASIDESGGSAGSFALLDSSRRTYARVAPAELRGSWLATLLLPKSAYAWGCASSHTFGSCTNNVITRTFDECVIGTTRTTGTVTLTYADGAVDNTCQMTAPGHSVTRVPAFTVTGRRGATLTVSKSGEKGQVITRGEGDTYSFSNDGIRRAFVTASGSTLFDFTTQTLSPITVTGTERANRVLTGGSLRVTNNLTGVTCDYTPTQVSWTEGCNCPTSGSWAGKCSDGKATSLAITGCGNGNLKVGEAGEAFTFDRCYEI